MTTRNQFLLVITMVALGIAMRLLPHPANVTPIAALALFSGLYLPRRFALIVPIAAMIVSDMLIGMHDLVAFTWGCFAVTGAIGWWVKKQKNIRRIIVGSLAGSVLFYLVTNAAVWALTPLYAKTAVGLAASYVAAVPFFRNTLLGDLFFVGLFVGAYELIAFSLRKRAVYLTQH